MKNFKKVALSLLVVGVALAGSAFTNAKIAIGDYLVQASDDTYTLVTQTNYQPGACFATDPDVCSYRQINSPLIGTLPFDADEIQDNLDAGTIEVFNSEGLYIPTP